MNQHRTPSKDGEQDQLVSLQTRKHGRKGSHHVTPCQNCREKKRACSGLSPCERCQKMKLTCVIIARLPWWLNNDLWRRCVGCSKGDKCSLTRKLKSEVQPPCDGCVKKGIECIQPAVPPPRHSPAAVPPPQTKLTSYDIVQEPHRERRRRRKAEAFFLQPVSYKQESEELGQEYNKYFHFLEQHPCPSMSEIPSSSLPFPSIHFNSPFRSPSQPSPLLSPV